MWGAALKPPASMIAYLSDFRVLRSRAVVFITLLFSCAPPAQYARPSRR